MSKSTIYLMGLITLLIFPLPTFIILWYLEGVSWHTLLDIHSLSVKHVSLGILFGILYALLALWLLRLKIYRNIPNHVEAIVRSMKLNTWECVFLSLCAGIGEELLFRVGIQFYLGPFLTAILFVAIHGYLNPFNWRLSLYGFMVLPFILVISYALPSYSIWFCIAAHFSYDLLLFLVISKRSPNNNLQTEMLSDQ